MESLNRKLYVDFKNGLESWKSDYKLVPYSPFLRHPVEKKKISVCGKDSIPFNYKELDSVLQLLSLILRATIWLVRALNCKLAVIYIMDNGLVLMANN